MTYLHIAIFDNPNSCAISEYVLRFLSISSIFGRISSRRFSLRSCRTAPPRRPASRRLSSCSTHRRPPRRPTPPKVQASGEAPARYPAEVAWVLDETPGLTGPAQISLRDDVSVVTVPGGGAASVADPEAVERWYVENLVPRRVATDLTYLRRPSLWATLRVIGWTARYILTGRPPEIRLGG